MGSIETRILNPDLWELYKSIRLGALKESPDAYGSTFEEEAALSDTDWRARLDLDLRELIALPLIATINSRPVGLAWGVIHMETSKQAYLYQMWVSPIVRGKGVGNSLLADVAAWAKGRGCTHLALSVTTTNEAAVRFYKAFGFTDRGPLEELRGGSSITVQPMTIELSRAS